MARTRGLGRAIGRVVGRDRPADEDAGDVPERRRPTASARRLRVHQMTTEGRDMAEDVVDMTDDVPEQPTEALEMRADAQGADSGEGSDGDDAAEGFAGGPRDPFHALSTEEARFLLTELLEVSAEEARAETALTLGAYSATYVHVVHLDAFRDLAHSGGYAWGVVALVHMYDQLDEACRTTTRQLAGYLTLLQCWIYEHFPSVHQCVTDDTYQETSPRASRWLTSNAHMKGITGAPYRARCDGLTVIDVSWLPYTEHRGVRAFQEISSFQGQLIWGPMIVTVRPERVVRQFGYIQSIPPPPVSARLSHDQIDDRWMEFADHLLPAGQLCLVPGQVSADYMEWFFRISHPFMTPTQAGDQQRDAPAADPEDYIQPPSPQVLVAFDPPPHVDDYEGYEAIAQRLERVLNLRIVTAGTELYDIMQDCLTITRGGPSADGTVRARQRRRTDH
ncbi:Protein MAINTENANCE OF MERISTEMS [Glycine soja]